MAGQAFEHARQRLVDPLGGGRQAPGLGPAGEDEEVASFGAVASPTTKSRPLPKPRADRKRFKPAPSESSGLGVSWQLWLPE